MRVELLYFEGCPNHENLLPRLVAILAEVDPGTEIDLRRVESPEDAERQHFLGSPTVRVDGRDVDPGAAERRDFGLKCRLYQADGGLSGTPPEHWIRNALTQAMQ